MTDEQIQQERKRVGQMIADIREKEGLTQRELGARSDNQAPHISRIEKGKYSVGLDTLASIGYAMGYRLEYVKIE